MPSEAQKDIIAALMYLEGDAGPPVTMMGRTGEESECSGNYTPIEVSVRDARRLHPVPTLTK